MKKILTILIASLLWFNIGYSKEIVNLVCSFQKSVTQIPFATSLPNEIVKTKDDFPPSITQDKYIEYEIISKDEFWIISTSFYMILTDTLPEKKQMNVDDKVISFVFTYTEDYQEIFRLNRHTGILQRNIQRFEEKIIDYYSCSKKSKI